MGPASTSVAFGLPIGQTPAMLSVGLIFLAAAAVVVLGAVVAAVVIATSSGRRNESATFRAPS